MKDKIIVILGPTATGKTNLSIELAQQFGGEIISGDSQQVYRNLDIGTAKATPEEQEIIPHHLLDVREVFEHYSAFDFVRDAQVIIEGLFFRGKLPIIVGGAGLYIQSLVEGYYLGLEVSHGDVLSYRKYLKQLPDEVLYRKIWDFGGNTFQLSRQEAMRYLEMKKFSLKSRNKKPNYDVLFLGLNDERDVLYKRINHRVEYMKSVGLLDEARWLYDHYPNVQATRGIGYKELFPYFQERISLEKALEHIKQNTRRFAKRQLTWFRNRMSVTFYRISDPYYKDQIRSEIEDFLSD